MAENTRGPVWYRLKNLIDFKRQSRSNNKAPLNARVNCQIIGCTKKRFDRCFELCPLCPYESSFINSRDFYRTYLWAGPICYRDIYTVVA